MDSVPPARPPLLAWLMFGFGPGPGEPSKDMAQRNMRRANSLSARSSATCARASTGGPSCVRRLPDGRGDPGRAGGIPLRGAIAGTDARSWPPLLIRAPRFAATGAANMAASSVTAIIAGSRSRRWFSLICVPCLCAGRPAAATQWRELARLCAWDFGGSAHPLAEPFGRAQACHDGRTLVPERLDLGSCLSRPSRSSSSRRCIADFSSDGMSIRSLISL